MRAVILTRAGWWNDQVHGDAGARLVLDDETAADLVERLRSAVYDPFGQAELDGAPSPQTTFVGPEAAARRMQELASLTEELGLYDTPELGLYDRGAEDLTGFGEDPAPAMKRPYGNASKAAWIDWAVYQGADAAEAAELTKNQLMARYGERL